MKTQVNALFVYPTALVMFALGMMLTVAGSLSAQEVGKSAVDLRRDGAPSLAAPSLTPEMWLYEQERQRYEKPAAAVHRNAASRAAERHRRIASRKWFGFSNSRPMASPTPWYDVYSPHWRGNSFNPSEWVGHGYQGAAYRPIWRAPRAY